MSGAESDAEALTFVGTNNMDEEQYHDLECPACHSSDIEAISEDEKIMGMGLYANFDFIGAINKITNEYRCLNCGYEW